MELKDIFIGRARKYNHFEDGPVVPAHNCMNCVRKHFSFPYTCEDGWENYRTGQAEKGARCRNWTDQGNAPVD